MLAIFKLRLSNKENNIDCLQAQSTWVTHFCLQALFNSSHKISTKDSYVQDHTIMVMHQEAKQ